jgi:hypothetical protein
MELLFFNLASVGKACLDGFFSVWTGISLDQGSAFDSDIRFGVWIIP